ncbi:MAG: AAA family ATPase, partial [Lachnospiraceae bacterium]|nr:AAA family ATPase [Lachnospiraceae bacterium]
MDFAERVSDEFPEMDVLSDYWDNRPELPPELIAGVLRQGHKMLISGASKAGKSFMLMELCIAIAEGTSWLGLKCKKGRVLYVNLEIDPASAICRFMNIYETLGIKMANAKNIVIWNLRGHAVPLDQLVPKLNRRLRHQNFDAIIIDPIYKVITGDENNASEMGYFCNQFDRICDTIGSSVIYCHHHSKGMQGAKRAMDRASGSGVFARDPDAQLDIIQLELSDDVKNNIRDGHATAWRMESSLREFANIEPINFWFEYPIHRLDNSGVLETCNTEGSFEAARAKNRKTTTPEERKASLDSAFEACSIEQPITIDAMAEYIADTPRCVTDRRNEFKKDYWCKGGIVGKVNK